MFYNLLVLLGFILFVNSDRIGDYNVYRFQNGNSNKYPRCFIDACKSSSTAMCNAPVVIGDDTWSETEICTAPRKTAKYLTGSSVASNNLTWDILINSDRCESKGFRYTPCGNLHDLNSNKMVWVGNGLTNDDNTCRNCPVCECSHPATATTWDNFWGFDTTTYLFERTCIKCNCRSANDTSQLLTENLGLDRLPASMNGGWLCSEWPTKSSQDFDFITNSSYGYFCGATTLSPTSNPVVIPAPTVNPTIIPTGAPTIHCPGNYSVGEYYFDNLNDNCKKFCVCQESGPYCVAADATGSYEPIATDRYLMGGFFQKCGKWVSECSNSNGTKLLFRATAGGTANCSADLGANDYNTNEAGYFQLMCPRCPCTYSKKGWYDIWNGSYVDNRIRNTSAPGNASYDKYQCVAEYECTNATGLATNTDTWFINVKTSGPTLNDDRNKKACTAPAHYCVQATTPYMAKTIKTTNMDRTSNDYDYCYWRNFTSDRTKTICLNGDPQPVNEYGTWGANENWLCEAFLNKSGNSGGDKCWNQVVSWKASRYNCWSLKWETEEINTRVRQKCCASTNYNYCNNQTILDGSKSGCGSNSLLANYYSVMWSRNYGNPGGWNDVDGAYLKCGINPMSNEGNFTSYFFGNDGGEKACSYLKSRFMDVVSPWCDPRKVLDQSGQLSDINRKYMWEEWDNQVSSFETSWTATHVKWYNYFNCSWNKYNASTRLTTSKKYDYPPYNLIAGNGVRGFGCVDTDLSHANIIKLSTISIVILLLSFIWS